MFVLTLILPIGGIGDLSPLNLYILDYRLQKYKNRLEHAPQIAQQLSFLLSLSPSLSLSLSTSPPHSLSLSVFLSLPLPLTLSLSLFLSPSLPLSIPLSLSPSLSLPPSLSLSPSGGERGGSVAAWCCGETVGAGERETGDRVLSHRARVDALRS